MATSDVRLNDAIIKGALDNLETAKSLLSRLADAYEDLNDSPGDDYDPERVEELVRRIEDIFSEVESLHP